MKRFCTLICTAAIAVAAIAQNEPTVYLPLDDDLNDVSGNELHAIAGGTEAVAFVTDAERGKVAHFVEAAHAMLPYNAQLAIGTGDYSVAFWVKVVNDPAPDGDPVIFTNKDWGSGSNPGLLVALDGADAVAGEHMWTVNFNAVDGSRLDWDADDNGAANLADGAWHHVAVTCDRDGTMDVYMDNVLYQTDPDTDSKDMTTAPGIADDETNGLPFTLFQDATGAYADGHDLEGWMDELRLFQGKILTTEEISLLYSYNGATSIKERSLNSGLDLNVYSIGGNQMQIEYNLEQPSKVALDVYNMLGAKVGAMNFTNKPPGAHTTQFDVSPLSAGIYIFMVHTSKGSETAKAFVVK